MIVIYPDSCPAIPLDEKRGAWPGLKLALKKSSMMIDAIPNRSFAGGKWIVLREKIWNSMEK